MTPLPHTFINIADHWCLAWWRMTHFHFWRRRGDSSNGLLICQYLYVFVKIFPVLWRLTRISDAIWITMECSCLDIDIHLLDKCAGRRIKIDVKVSHFGMFSRADLCTLDMVNSRKRTGNISLSQVPDWPTYFGAGITWSYSQSKQ